MLKNFSIFFTPSSLIFIAISGYFLDNGSPTMQAKTITSVTSFEDEIKSDSFNKFPLIKV